MIMTTTTKIWTVTQHLRVGRKWDFCMLLVGAFLRPLGASLPPVNSVKTWTEEHFHHITSSSCVLHCVCTTLPHSLMCLRLTIPLEKWKHFKWVRKAKTQKGNVICSRLIHSYQSQHSFTSYSTKLLLSITMCLEPQDGCEACLWGTGEHSGRACALISCPYSWDRPVEKSLPVSTSQFTSSKLTKTGSYSVKESQPHTQLVNRKQDPRESLGKVTEARGWRSGACCMNNS